MTAHNLVIYQLPKLGNKPLRSLSVFNYKHKINSYGWFDTASCDLVLPNFSEGQRFVESMPGARVAVFVDNPYEPIWEGLISRVTLSAGGSSYTVSIEDMYNRVKVQYITGADTYPVHGASGQSDQSISKYGIKEGTIALGPIPGGTGTQHDGMRKAALELVSWPQSSITEGEGAAAVHLEMVGIYDTLRWQTRVDVSTTTLSYTAYLQSYVLAVVANGAIFFDYSDYSGLETVAAVRSRGDAPGKTLWDQAVTHAQAGDNNGTPYIIGITPTDPRTNKRKMYYRPANLNVEYTAWRRDGFRVRNHLGRLVPPWRVRPDRVLRINDMLLAYGLPGDDPREVYIQSIEYDGETGKVRWYGADDTSFEGAMQYKQGMRPLWYGRRNGGRYRVS